jgi:protein kinase A
MTFIRLPYFMSTKVSLLSANLPTFIVVTKSQFMMKYVIGKGGFGRVWKIQEGENEFAMKEMSKQRILSKKSINSVLNERNLLSMLRHQFIVFSAFLQT